MMNSNLNRMKFRMLRTVGAIVTALFLVACTPATLSSGPSAGHLRTEDKAKTTGTIPVITSYSIHYTKLYDRGKAPTTTS